MSRDWVGVASNDHVRAAVRGGFCQLNHGAEAPLRRLQPGDRLFYYSPRERMDPSASIKAFTAVGKILDGEPYKSRTKGGFQPFRRKVHYFAVNEAVILPLLPRLSFTKKRKSWGIVMRRGFFPISQKDARTIAEAMGVHE